MNKTKPGLMQSLQNPQGANFSLETVPEGIEYRPVGLTSEDGAISKGLFWRLRGARPKVGVHLMHPRTDQSQNYNILPLAAAGYAVLGRASRWPNNDVATIHERLLLDVAAGVKFLREQGCERVILLGNSGGSSLAAYYQAQASAPKGSRHTHTPAGDPLDLNQYDLPPADGVVIVAGHVGQGMLIGKMIDPAVVDENDPLATDPALDMYSPANGFDTQSGTGRYAPEFLERFRAAQTARVRRIDTIARQLIGQARDAAGFAASSSGDPDAERRALLASKVGWHMVVYRTTAYPAFVDLSIEPDDRIVYSYFSARPDLENHGENGFARYVTPRAWLSTWSPESSHARTIDNLARIREPLLVVHYAGDAATRISEVEAMRAACGSEDKTLEVIRGVEHYGHMLKDSTRKQRSSLGTDKVVGWMQERFPV
ncbi:MAG: alpha/beta hydrolase [Gammaproteobacteria bacterium]|nr:alpha/beta hydrolase [Gammaproteobacteria bacterium]